MAAICVSGRRFSEQEFELLKRLRDFYGDPAKRWNDRLNLFEKTICEEYVSGRAALVLECNVKSIGSFYVRDGGIREQKPARDRSLLFILKAHVTYQHKLQHWDKKLMLVDDVQIVQGPDSRIPSLVGFYYLRDSEANHGTDLLIFKSFIQFGYKFFPRVSDGKSSPLGRSSTTEEHAFVINQVQGTPKIVESLEETVKFLMDDPTVKSLVHREFEEVARQIDDLIREGKMKKLLYSMTPRGPAN